MTRIGFFGRPIIRDPIAGLGNPAFRLHDSMSSLPAGTIVDPGIAAAYGMRFSRGHIAVTASDDDSVVFRCWIATGALQIDEAGLYWRIPYSNICIYDCFTYPARRRRGCYVAALKWITGSDKFAGRQSRALIYADTRNQASLRGIANAGFQNIGEIMVLRLFGRIVLRKGVAPGDEA